MQNDIIFFRGKRNYQSLTLDNDTNKYKITENIDVGDMDSEFMNIINQLDKKINSSQIYKELARSYTLFRFIERIHGIDIANKINNEWGFDGDITEQNAIDSINLLKNTIGKGAYVFKYGYGNLIEKLHEYMRLHGIKINLNTCLTNIQKYEDKYICKFSGSNLNNITGSNSNNITRSNLNDIIGSNVILAIPKHALCKIKYLSSIKKSLLNNVISKELIRIYLVFPVENGIPWFDHLLGVNITNTILRQIIPIDKKLGILMIYSAGIAANNLNNLDKCNILVTEIMFHLRRIYSSSSIPDPVKAYRKYWKHATHIWKPCVDSESINKKIIKPFSQDKIFIVGEAYSMNQQWSNGALETVNNLLNIIE